MLFSINGVARLVRDPEIRYLPSGMSVVKLGLATSKKGKEGREEVCFVDATAFGKTAETINSYLKRGSQISIVGELRFEQWADNVGQNRSKHTILIEKFAFVDSKSDSQNQAGYNLQHQPQSESRQQESNHTYIPIAAMDKMIPEIDIDEEEIPFNEG